MISSLALATSTIVIFKVIWRLMAQEHGVGKRYQR